MLREPGRVLAGGARLRDLSAATIRLWRAVARPEQVATGRPVQGAWGTSMLVAWIAGHRRAVLAIVGSSLLLLGGGGMQLALGGVSAASDSSPLLGVYTGYGNVSGAKGFASTTGADVTIAADYQDGSSWGSLDSGEPADEWTGSGYQLALGVPMYPSGGSLADGAAGDYNSYFKTLAQNLVEAGEGDAILHIGWEWNVSGSSWYVSDATDGANYAAFWQQIVTTMRSVPGANFNYAWYDGDAAGSTEAWPGASYVSSIDLDFYDQTWDSSCGLPFNNTATPAESQCVWNNDMLPELTTFADFATQYSEPMGFGEWGVISRSDGHGLGDDPTFVNNFANWMKANNVEYANYFDFNSGGNSVLTDFPNSLAAYQADFG